MVIKEKYQMDKPMTVYCNGICLAVDREGEEDSCKYLGFDDVCEADCSYIKRVILDYKK